ncbi:hypothetical protein HZH68_004731 [Vespula germanica]|uniref:Uncharacterized protein n=1 Tax=Vespula germanica TaxID=30212 RepID=A0A834KPP6_VESGE|nr:hypothetical protein HZH68_004731 [Vespula germanica]
MKNTLGNKIDHVESTTVKTESTLYSDFCSVSTYYTRNKRFPQRTRTILALESSCWQETSRRQEEVEEEEEEEEEEKEERKEEEEEEEEAVSPLRAPGPSKKQSFERVWLQSRLAQTTTRTITSTSTTTTMSCRESWDNASSPLSVPRSLRWRVLLEEGKGGTPSVAYVDAAGAADDGGGNTGERGRKEYKKERER